MQDESTSKIIEEYLSLFPNLRSPAFEELSVFIPETMKNFLDATIKYKMRSITEGKRYSHEKSPGDDYKEIINRNIPCDFKPANKSPFSKIINETRSNALLEFISNADDVRSSENISPVVFDEANLFAGGKYVGVIPHARRLNVLNDWIENDRMIADPSVITFALDGSRMDWWIIDLMRAFNRDIEMVNIIVQRQQTPEDINRVAIEEVFRLLNSKDKEMKKKGDEIGTRILKKDNFDLWARLAMAGTGKVSREASFKLANSPDLSSGTDLDKHRFAAFDSIVKDGKKSHVKIVVNSYDTWTSVIAPGDCSVLKSIMSVKDAKVATTGFRLVKEKCPDEYLDMIPSMTKGATISTNEQILGELLSLHPYSTTKMEGVKKVITGIAKEGNYKEKKGLENVLNRITTTVDVCDAISILSKDDDQIISSFVETEGLKDKHGC